MAGSGTWNGYTWNGATWNGGAGAALVVSYPVPVRVTCLSVPSSLELALELPLGCEVPLEYNVPREDGLIVGTDRRFRLALTEMPTGKTISQAKFYLKVAEESTSALIEKTITTSASAQGQITDAGTDEEAELYYNLTNTDTAALSRKVTYHYYAKLTYSDGVIEVPVFGSWSTLPVRL